jgi:CheY-like chemotaxis protein
MPGKAKSDDLAATVGQQAVEPHHPAPPTTLRPLYQSSYFKLFVLRHCSPGQCPIPPHRAYKRRDVKHGAKRSDLQQKLRGHIRDAAERHIYVLDDDPDMLRALEGLLKVHGFRPKLFRSSEDFLASIDNDDDALCLLLDVHLNGASGIDVKRHLMRSGVRLPVIFITANDNEVIRRSIADVGYLAYLPKPFSARLASAIICTGSGCSRVEWP